MKKTLSLIFCLFFIQCTSLKKADYNSVLENKTSSQGDILTTLREISSLSADDFSFMTDKMKNIVRNYKTIEKKLTLVEEKVDRLIVKAQSITNSEKDSKIEIEELSEDALFKKDSAEDSEKSEQNISTTEESQSDLFEEARALYREKSWQSAISKFEQYREENPKSLRQPEAIFYIAESFKNLSMLPESHIFYREVITKYPDTSWAKQSKKILKK